MTEITEHQAESGAPGADDLNRCAAINRTGERAGQRCRRPRLDGLEVCNWHSPARDAQRLDWAKAGGRARHAQRVAKAEAANVAITPSALPALDLTSAASARAWIEHIVREMAARRMGAQVGNSIIRAIDAATRVSSLELRHAVAALAKQVETMRQKGATS
jgi:hypothetical protein